ncbi:MAG: SIS domain-containing protein, partial [Candidatus Tectomicrobia bacterium]|nr:SIS domain-containing protein [Candidatus Tectomicrobia bacterium]
MLKKQGTGGMSIASSQQSAISGQPSEGASMEISEERKSMYDQIVSQPALIREMFEPIDTLIRATLNRNECRKWQRIFLAGCGDSYYTGLACELAIEQFARLPVEPMSSLQFSRYSVDFIPPHSVLFGISNSGRVSRSIEAVILAREAGMETVAITGNPGSPITSEAHYTLGVKIPAISPGVRSYTISLLTTLLTALYLGECRGSLSTERATQLRGELRGVADLMEETNEILIDQCYSLAEALEKENLFIFVGGGPNYATALFSAAKIVEACGSYAYG